ncbi:MAG TPA: YetF domain-containing protein [Burkholderiales bacterium]|jgi:uncharacterized membrane protein YcaP (DUF421 family)|nr:YetF domain-containing protein [Burkholderiales bacterium]
MPSINWHEMFALSVSPFELMIRGSLIYVFLFVVFRVILRRDVGSVAIADVLVLVILADAAQNAMAGEYRSVTDGIVLLSTIIGWNVLFDYLTFRFPAVRRVLEAPQLLLVQDGRYIHRNMRREFLTAEDVESKLREHGIENLSAVKAAYMENDGSISVIKKK